MPKNWNSVYLFTRSEVNRDNPTHDQVNNNTPNVDLGSNDPTLNSILTEDEVKEMYSVLTSQWISRYWQDIKWVYKIA